MTSLRIDKWLWAARFYKTRSLASEEIGKNRVQVNGQDAKPSKEVKPGDTVCLRQGAVERTVPKGGFVSPSRCSAVAETPGRGCLGAPAAGELENGIRVAAWIRRRSNGRSRVASTAAAAPIFGF